MKMVWIDERRWNVPAIVVGCMRLGEMDGKRMNAFLHAALEQGANYFDHADIYAGGKSEEIFGQAVREDSSIKREDLIIQSKCGICKGFYDLSKKHIIESVDGSLKRLQTDYLDVLLIHRPDALIEPEEVASAFDELEKSGKVRHFGVSNHKPMQIELLKRYIEQPLIINQLQFSLPVSNMVANGMEVNMETEGSIDRDGSVLDYSRLHDMTIQAWSPFQMPNWQGCFLGNDAYADLNEKIEVLAETYGTSATAIAAAWIFRHPAGMQLITGTTKPERLKEIIASSDIVLTREEWYQLYLAAGHLLP
ncbi:MAG TPA: aldo/keto reductase [Candidatus Fimousia stercorigallinarum]|nr:aldo/keto reductase [Candidatus Fimousia stercorigallinarum]